MPIIAITGGIASGKSSFARMLQTRLQELLNAGESGAGNGAEPIRESVRVELFDADAVSRELTRENGEALPAIIERFGVGILETFLAKNAAPDAASRQLPPPKSPPLSRPLRLNRSLLRELAFADPQFRRSLEAILHPLILGRWAEQIAAGQACAGTLSPDPTDPSNSPGEAKTASHPASDSIVSTPPAPKSPQKTWFLGDIPLLFEAKCEKTWDLAIVIAAPEETQLARLREKRGLGEPLARRILATQATQMSPAAKVASADVVVWNAAQLTCLEAQTELLAQTLLNRFSDRFAP